jgi:hypothetical protein
MHRTAPKVSSRDCWPDCANAAPRSSASRDRNRRGGYRLHVMPPRVYLLSPAHCGGRRAQLIFNDKAAFDLALRIRRPRGASVGEVFTFLSGLYFRGKAAYAQTFAQAGGKGRADASIAATTMVITTNRGLIPIDTRITLADLGAMAVGDIDPEDEAYREPLERDARRLAARLGPDGRAILLGSVASGKYVDILLEALGERLLFPREFVGRGDMSRGGLMLRCVRSGTPLTYIAVQGAVRRGGRPPRLEPLRRGAGGTPKRSRDAVTSAGRAGGRR